MPSPIFLNCMPKIGSNRRPAYVQNIGHSSIWYTFSCLYHLIRESFLSPVTQGKALKLDHIDFIG